MVELLNSLAPTAQVGENFPRLGNLKPFWSCAKHLLPAFTPVRSNPISFLRCCSRMGTSGAIEHNDDLPCVLPDVSGVEQTRQIAA